MRTLNDAVLPTLDVEAILRVFDEVPVRTAILYGSHARGEASAGSDVDIAVQFDDAVSSVERTRARLELIERLSAVLDTDDIDITPISHASPGLRREVYEDGVVLYGDTSALDEEQQELQASTHEERLAEFDDVLATLERVV